MTKVIDRMSNLHIFPLFMELCCKFFEFILF